jgi:hypothetical protein
LDLLSLLTIPLAFSLFGWQAQNDSPTKQPLAILEALRRHAEHTLIFCQAGAIHVPENASLLLAGLEESIIEVKPLGKTGVFHPKIWLLRFMSTDDPVLYRFLCASRNITFDRSWDTILVLEGELEERENGFSMNRPLADFISALPKLATNRIQETRADIYQTLEKEIKKVQFTLPDGFEEIAFRPLGIDGYRRWPFPEDMGQLLVVSPFVTASLLQRLSKSAKEAVLVSRAEALQELSRKQLSGFSRIFTLAAEADPELESEQAEDPFLETVASGLHAKLYVADLGWHSKVWTGSANATTAAFENNIEFLVELEGLKSICGVDSVLELTPGKMKLADLLQKFVPEKTVAAFDLVQHAIEEQKEEAKRRVIDSRLRARIDAEGQEDMYRVTLHSTPEEEHTAVGQEVQIEICCWPITLPEGQAASVKQLNGEVARFNHLSFPSLTAFFAFRIDAAYAGKKQSYRFVLNLPIEGAPKDRRERLLRYLLKDRNQVLRLLLLMLADVDDGIVDQAAVRKLLAGSQPEFGSVFSDALLEPLLQALSRNPEKLDDVARLVSDLESTPEGQAMLPEDFHEIWDPIWAAKEDSKT